MWLQEGTFLLFHFMMRNLFSSLLQIMTSASKAVSEEVGMA